MCQSVHCFYKECKCISLTRFLQNFCFAKVKFDRIIACIVNVLMCTSKLDFSRYLVMWLNFICNTRQKEYHLLLLFLVRTTSSSREKPRSANYLQSLAIYHYQHFSSFLLSKRTVYSSFLIFSFSMHRIHLYSPFLSSFP